MAGDFVKWGKSEKEKLTDEMHKLETEIESLGTAVSDAQIWHKRARIDAIKKEIKELETKQLNAGDDKLKALMAQQSQMLNPEQMAKIKQQGRGQ